MYYLLLVSDVRMSFEKHERDLFFLNTKVLIKMINLNSKKEQHGCYDPSIASGILF